MSKITLNSVGDGSFLNASTAAATINANNGVIQAAINNTLSLDGTTPNQMQAPFDMNSQQIINLPNPATSLSPLRLKDLTSFIGGGTVSTVPAGGTTGQGLTKASNADYNMAWTNVDTSVGLSMPADFTVTGSPVTGSGTLAVTLANTATGTGGLVRQTSPTLVTPALGTPSSLTLTNATSLPINTGVSGLATGIAGFLGTPTSANLAGALTDETGTGAAVFATSPTLVTPILGTPTSGNLVNCTGLVAAAGTLTGTTLASNVVSSSLTSLGTITTLNATNINAFTLGGTVSGGGNQLNNIIIGTTTPLAGSFTSVTSPILKSAAAIQFQTNGTTFAGNITTGQQWFLSGTSNTPPTGPILTVSKNTSALPAIGTPAGIGGTAQLGLIVAGSDAAATDIAIQSFGNFASGIRYLTAGGTAASRTATTGVGGTLAANFAYSYTGTAYAASCGFIFSNTETTVGAGNTGGRVDLFATPVGTTGIVNTVSVGNSLMVGTTTDGSVGQLIINNAAFMIRTKTAFTNGAAAATGTLTNAPAAGNPTKWIAIDDNGTTRQIPAW